MESKDCVRCEKVRTRHLTAFVYYNLIKKIQIGLNLIFVSFVTFTELIVYLPLYYTFCSDNLKIIINKKLQNYLY